MSPLHFFSLSHQGQLAVFKTQFVMILKSFTFDSTDTELTLGVGMSPREGAWHGG